MFPPPPPPPRPAPLAFVWMLLFPPSRYLFFLKRMWAGCVLHVCGWFQYIITQHFTPQFNQKYIIHNQKKKTNSGDLAVMNPNGYLKVTDRSKDVIISGGENISSIEVQDVVCKKEKKRESRQREERERESERETSKRLFFKNCPFPSNVKFKKQKIK